MKDWTSPAHDFIEMGEFPVAPFVCAFVLGTTRKRARAVSTALPKQREPCDSSYLEHSHQSKVSLRKPDLPRYGAVRVLAGCWPGAVKVSAVLLTFLLTDAPIFLLNGSASDAEVWRRRSESNRVALLTRPILTPALTGPSSDRQRNRL